MIYALVLVILILCGLIGWLDWNNRKERKTLLNAILAKTNDDLVNLNISDMPTVPDMKEELPEGYVPLESLSDEEFEKAIK